MSGPEPLWALGLMSGTSLDGIDAALLRTDGEAVVEFGPFLTVPYSDTLRERLRGVLGGNGPVASVERELTHAHAAAVEALLSGHGYGAGTVDVVGFHGQTILHEPAARRTWQIGDGALLAELVGIDVVNDFRSADVAAGGEGAPLAPLFHAALARCIVPPTDGALGVVNIGGVANLTWIGDVHAAVERPLLAFDTGPGVALVDDWVRTHTGDAFDRDGALAAAGRVSEEALRALLAHPYLDKAPPKSLDRDDFDPAPVSGLAVADGAATLVAFTAAAVSRALDHVPATPRRWLITGGGRKNPMLMAALRQRLNAPVAAVEDVGWSGDALEAQAFGYHAVRALDGRPLSLPTTTGVGQPMPGGRLHRTRRR